MQSWMYLCAVKKVQENSDRVWQDAADYNIGDTSPSYQVLFLQNYDKYTKYLRGSTMRCLQV